MTAAPYEKRFRTIVPVLNDLDHDTARWLARESFEKKANNDGLELIDYAEREVPRDEIPPQAVEVLGGAIADYTWFEFSGLARLNRELFDWLSAEIVWKQSVA